MSADAEFPLVERSALWRAQSKRLGHSGSPVIPLVERSALWRAQSKRLGFSGSPEAVR